MTRSELEAVEHHDLVPGGHEVRHEAGLAVAATHGSPWSYDTFVPVIFAGAGLEPQKIYREIHTIDVAPTLSAFARTKPPSGSRGKVLVEVLEHP